MIWTVILLLGKIALCLADPKSFVYVSEIEDDEYPPPVDFKYFDRQRYIPPHLQKYSLTSNSNVNPKAKDGSGIITSGGDVPSSRGQYNPSSSPRTDKNPSLTANKPETPSLSAYNTGTLTPSGPGRHSSSSSLPRNNPSKNRSPSSYVTFHPPGTISNINPGSRALPGQTGTRQDVSSQDAFGNSPVKKRKLINPESVVPYSIGGNTGVLPPQSIIRSNSAPFRAGNSGVSRSPTFTYSSPSGSDNFQPPLRDFDLSPNRDTRDDSQKIIGNSLKNPTQSSEEGGSSNQFRPINPTDIINKLPGCPLPGKRNDGNPDGSRYPASRPNSSFRRSVTYGGGDLIGVVVTSVNRQSAFYNPSFGGGRNTSEQYYSQLPRRNSNKIKPALASYQYSNLGNPTQLDGRSRQNNVPKPQSFSNRGVSDSLSQNVQTGSNLNSQRPQDFNGPNLKTEIDGNDRYSNSRQGGKANSYTTDGKDNLDIQSPRVRAHGSIESGNNGQTGTNQRNSNVGGLNNNRQGPANAPIGGTKQSSNNNILTNRPQISSNIGNSAQQYSQNDGNQNIAGNREKQRTEYSLYRPASYQTERLPQPHEKYPAVGINEYFGPAHLAIAPLPPDVDGDQIPGQAWVDYPLHHVIPATSFSCGSYPLNGYYADMESSCQVYHFCQPGGVQTSFLCPNGTIFSQKKFACQWWYKTDCTESQHYFSLNSNLYKIPVKADTKS